MGSRVRATRRPVVHRCIGSATSLICLLAVVMAVDAPQSHAESLKVGGTGGALGAVRLVADAFRKVHPDVEIKILPSVGSSGAIKAVAAGKLSVGITARALEEDEKRQGLAETPYAKTPFVFAVGKKTPVSGLTSKQVADIYAGTTKEWSDGKMIRLVLRPEGDSDTAVLRGMSPEMDRAVRSAHSRKGLTIAMTDQDSAEMIEKTPGSFGTQTLAQILTDGRPIKPLSLDGVAPTAETLAGGKYPLSKQFYAVTEAAPSDHSMKFVDFLRSAEARSILRRTGHWVPK